MTTSQNTEYEVMPLAASSTGVDARPYGDHPIPTEGELTSLELPELLAQKVDGCPVGDE